MGYYDRRPNRDKLFTMRMTPDELAELAELARARNCRTTSGLVRVLIRDERERQKAAATLDAAKKKTSGLAPRSPKSKARQASRRARARV